MLKYHTICWLFQEYKQSLEILSKAYYPNITNTSAVESGNIDLMSDIMFGDSILKAVILQANANNKGVDKGGQKKTFLLRYKSFDSMKCFAIMNFVHLTEINK